MANLFLDGIFDDSSGSPSTVRLKIPQKSNNTNHGLDLKGLLIGDPSFSLQNKWGALVPDMSAMTDLTTLVGSANLFTWIAASTNVWKGTAPISLSFSFYLINYKSQGLNFESKLKQLAKLATLGKAKGKLAGVRSTVHGGYQANLFKDNSKFFSKDKVEHSLFTGKSTFDAGKISSKEWSQMAENVNAMKTDGFVESAITVQFGNKITIPNLLLSKIEITKSATEVASVSGNSIINIKPLYYKVDVQFVGVYPAVTDDIDFIFG